MDEEEVRKIEEFIRAVGTGQWDETASGARPVHEPKLEFEDGGREEKDTTWQDLKSFIAPIEWDWPKWLPRGFVTILASEPGMGKSLVCLRLAACYLAGQAWPDGTPFVEEWGQVVWCEGEGSQALNVARAEAWQLDLSQILSPLRHPMTPFRMDDEIHMSTLYQFCRRSGTKLVIMDSLSTLQRGGSVPDLLADLGEIARSTKVPIVVTHHLRKRTTLDRRDQVDQDRLRGTSRIAQAVRVVWSLDAPDITDPTHRRLTVVKNNLMPAVAPLGMRIKDSGLEFGTPPLEGGRVVSQVEAAAEFLVDLLEEGPMVFEEVRVACLAAGVTERTMQRAKERLGIVSFRPRGEKRWYWGRE